jgi:hypothetical protein
MIITSRNKNNNGEHISIDTETIKGLWDQAHDTKQFPNSAKVTLIKDLREFGGRNSTTFVLGLKEAKDKVESCKSADEMVAAFMGYSTQMPDPVTQGKAEVMGKIMMDLEKQISDARSIAHDRRMELERLEGEIDGLERALNLVKHSA